MSSLVELAVRNIYRDKNCLENAKKNGLSINTISWEDTARYKGSCWGPNISDMTLKSNKINYPVIRYPNFSDKTCDIDISKFNITVGNETTNGKLTRISLKEYLENIGQYVKRSSGSGIKSMYCKEKDSHVLASAQFCILPLQNGTVEFNVNLYNYQSSSSNPGVLVLVASQKGTSAQAIFGGTTDLYFNVAGKSANFIAERLKDERKRLGKDLEAKMDQDERERNALFIFQIPLKIKSPTRSMYVYSTNSSSNCSSNSLKPQEEDCKDLGFSIFDSECEYEEQCNEICGGLDEIKRLATRSLKRGMDNAVLSVGQTHSDFLGVKDFDIERDPNYPIRVTIQKYKVTDTEVIDSEVFIDIKNDINRIYSGNIMGSLVTENNTGRTTEWDPFGTVSSSMTKTISNNEIKNKPMFAL